MSVIEKAKIVSQSIVTWAGFAILMLTAIMAEVSAADWFPEGAAGPVLHFGAIAVGALTSIVAVIKRVTPVPPEGFQVVVEGDGSFVETADVVQGWE